MHTFIILIRWKCSCSCRLCVFVRQQIVCCCAQCIKILWRCRRPLYSAFVCARACVLVKGGWLSVDHWISLQHRLLFVQAHKQSLWAASVCVTQHQYQRTMVVQSMRFTYAHGIRNCRGAQFQAPFLSVFECVSAYACDGCRCGWNLIEYSRFSAIRIACIWLAVRQTSLSMCSFIDRLFIARWFVYNFAWLPQLDLVHAHYIVRIHGSLSSCMCANGNFKKKRRKNTY